VRYITNSPSIKIVLTRTMVTGIIGGSGIGADAAGGARLAAWRRANLRHQCWAPSAWARYRALNISEVRRRMSGEAGCVAGALLMAAAIAAGSVEQATGADRGSAGGRRRGVDAGGGAVQYRRAALAPRWVAGRSLAAFQASIAGGIADRSWGWDISPTSPAWRPRFWLLRLMFCRRCRAVATDAADRRAQRGGLRSARRSRGATVADRPQRALVSRSNIASRRKMPAPFTM